MNEIEVRSISAEEIEHGVAELWRDGEQIAYTVYDPYSDELVLRIDSRKDGEPLVVGVRRLAEALAEAERVLAAGRPRPTRRTTHREARTEGGRYGINFQPREPGDRGG